MGNILGFDNLDMKALNQCNETTRQRFIKQIDKENNEYFFGIDSIVIEHPGCL